MRSQISQYPKVVSSVYDAQKNAQVISVSNVQRLAALGCSSEVKIVRIESPSGITDMCTYTNAPVNSTITDISWATLDIGKLAIAYSNGSITCLNVAEKASRQSQILSEEWNSGKISTGVNRISWHPFESNTIASANQDGIVRIFDFRTSGATAKVTTYGQRGFVATRDIEFDPFHADIFAEVSENGSLKMWDRRFTSKPLVNKTKAHNGQVLTVSWSPCWEWVLATGSKDKTVKIWDFSTCPIQYQDIDSSKSNGSSGNNGSGAWEPEVVNTIYTHSEVSRLRWSITNTSTNGSANNTIAPLLATISTSAGTSAESPGHIAVWDLLNQNIPLCILKGHGQDLCADFSWLNHSTALSPIPLVNAGPSNNASTTDRSASSSIASLVNPRRAGRGGNNNSGKQQPDTRRKGQNSEATSPMSLPGSGLSNKSNPDEAPARQLNPVTALVLGILSAGRDGKILIQDLRYGYFPNHHISPSVIAISSQGHAAFHRGYVHKKFSTSVRSPYYFGDFESYLSALASFRKRQAPDLPAPFGTLKQSDSSDSLNSASSASFSTSSKQAPVNLARSALAASSAQAAAVSSASTSTSAVPLDRRTGVVFFGGQTIASLEDAKRIRSERGAEARVTDPALIAIFARRYRVPCTLSEDPNDFPRVVLEKEFENAEEEEHYRWERIAERQHRQAIRACKANLEAAVDAGLHCRVAVWTTLLSLLPPPTRALPTRLEEEVSLSESPLPVDFLENSPLLCVLEPDSPMPALSRQSSRVPSQESSVKHKPRNPFPELPFTLELIGTLLGELLEGGDVQHFVVACEILRQGGILPAVCKAVNMSDVQVQRGYLVYIDLLTKLGLFCEATDLIKASEDKYISTLNQQGVQVGMKCAACNKELTANTATGWCDRCARSVSMCVLCNKPAPGLIHWCPVCAHGGHLACTKRWFAQSDECPAGCGHNCCSTRMVKTDRALVATSTGVVLAEQEAHKRMEWLQNLEYCLSVSNERGRSNSRTANRIIGSTPAVHVHAGSAHHSHSNNSPRSGSFDISSHGNISRATERQLLRRRRFQALQASRR